MSETIEKEVPSTRPWLLRASLWLLGLTSPALIYGIVQAAINNNPGEIAIGAFSAGAASLCAYLIARKARNPDRITIDDAGFAYKFLNITFRVGWEDVENISLEENVIRLRLHNTEKVAANSLIERVVIPSRNQFNPFRRAILRRFTRLQRQMPQNSRDLLEFIEELEKRRGCHIAIPVFESAEEAEKLMNEMRSRHSRRQPAPVEFREEAESEPQADMIAEAEPQRERQRESQ
jgi:hypothetical protein